MIENINYTSILSSLYFIWKAGWPPLYESQMVMSDFLYTPLYAIFIYSYAYMRRRHLTDSVTRKYYFPALTLKIIGAIAVGVIYQHYYITGDTYMYYWHTKIMYKAFWESSPLTWAKIVFFPRDPDRDTYMYLQTMFFDDNPNDMLVPQIASIFGVIGLDSYPVIAIFFAMISFFGLWAMFKIFYDLYPYLHKQFAIAIFFIPSLFFWGSGLMKDTIALGSLAWLFYAFYRGAIEKKSLLKNLLIITTTTCILFVLRVYIILIFFPPAILWILDENTNRIRIKFLRSVIRPFAIILGLALGYFIITKATEGTAYELSKLADKVHISAKWLYHVSQTQSGAGYKIGNLDGSIESLLIAFPQAVNVALFRPYLTEVKNPVMLVSALESTFFLLFTLWVFYKVGLFRAVHKILTNPLVRLCVVFSIGFAFTVGIASFNFGTLMRYRILLIPFYMSSLFIILYESRRRRTP